MIAFEPNPAPFRTKRDVPKGVVYKLLLRMDKLLDEKGKGYFN